MKKEHFNNTVKFSINRPQMVGIKTLGELRAYLEGYFIATTFNSIEEDTGLKKFKKEFDWYVQDYFNEKTTEGWVSLITKRYTTEEESLKKFESLFYDFIKETKD